MKTLERTDSVSMAATFNGAAIHTESMEGYSIAASWTETTPSLVGTLKLQASNNAFTNNVNNNEDAAALWVDLPGSAAAVSGAGSQFWNVSDVYYKSVRVVWTRTSGAGTYTAYVWAKGNI